MKIQDLTGEAAEYDKNQLVGEVVETTLKMFKLIKNPEITQMELINISKIRFRIQ